MGDQPDTALAKMASELQTARQERGEFERRLKTAEKLRKGLPVCPLLIAAQLSTGRSLSRHRADGDTRIEKAAECYMERCGFYQSGRCKPGKAAKQ